MKNIIIKYKGTELLPQTLNVYTFIFTTQCCKPIIFQTMNS